MSEAFSTFDNTGPSEVLVGTALSQMGHSRLDFLPATVPKGQGGHNLDHFRVQLSNARDRFNLDQSEAACRIFIELFIAEALIGDSRSAIVSTEFSIPASTSRLEHGRLDYLVSSIDSETKSPILFPSIIIEAKKDLLSPDNASRENGQWQLLSELLTLVQLSRTTPPFLRGIFTEGRYWNFIEVSLTAPKGNPFVMRSGRIDVVDASNEISDNAVVVQSSTLFPLWQRPS